MTQRLERLQGHRRDEQLTELRLYRLAKQSVPWKKGDTGYPPPEGLEFLSKIVTEKGHDTWTTFMRFSEAWAANSWGTKQLEKKLPRIDEAGEEDYQEEQDQEEEGFTKAMNGLNEKLSSILSKFKGVDDTERPSLLEAFSSYPPVRPKP
jgi:hypothetical protein